MLGWMLTKEDDMLIMLIILILVSSAPHHLTSTDDVDQDADKEGSYADHADDIESIN